MAFTIPSYGPSQVSPTVAPTVREDTQAPLENFGGGQSVNDVAGAASSLAKDTNDIYLQQKKAADNAIGQDVYAKLTQKKNDLIYDPQNGAMTKKGQDALTVTNDYGQAYKDYADQISSTLTNDDQRIQFAHFNRVVGDELNSTLQKHTFSETQELQTTIASTAVKSAQDDAVLNYHEPGKVEENVQLQTNLLTNTLKHAGLPQEVIDAQVGEAKSKTYVGVIDRMLVNGEDAQAKAYYDSVKGNITGADASAVEKSLEAGSMRGESQRQSDQIVRAHSSLSTALDVARQIEDPKLRDETTKRVKDYFSDQQQAQKIDDDTRFNNASQILEKGKSLDKIPPQMLSALPSAQRRALEVRFTQLRDGIEPEANSETKYNLQQMAVTPELRDKFLQLNLPEYRHQVTQSELASLMTTQASLRKSDGVADDTVRGLRTKNQVVTETLKQLGVDKDPDAVLTINRQLDDQVQQFHAAHGKKPNGADIQKMLDNIVVKAKDPNGGFFGMFNSGPAYSFGPNSNLTVNVDNIPQTEKAQIVKALKARSIPVTDDKIVDLYSRKLNGTRSRGQ